MVQESPDLLNSKRPALLLGNRLRPQTTNGLWIPAILSVAVGSLLKTVPLLFHESLLSLQMNSKAIFIFRENKSQYQCLWMYVCLKFKAPNRVFYSQLCSMFSVPGYWNHPEPQTVSQTSPWWTFWGGNGAQVIIHTHAALEMGCVLGTPIP